MNIKMICGISLAAIFAVSMSLTLSGELIPEAVAKGPPVTHRVSTTVSYDSGFLLDGVIVLLDTTGSGTLSDIHVAANLPCTGFTGDAGSGSPNVFIIAAIVQGGIITLMALSMVGMQVIFTKVNMIQFLSLSFEGPAKISSKGVSLKYS